VILHYTATVQQQTAAVCKERSVAASSSGCEMMRSVVYLLWFARYTCTAILPQAQFGDYFFAMQLFVVAAVDVTAT
jgi:hypothetical protein